MKPNACQHRTAVSSDDKYERAGILILLPAKDFSRFFAVNANTTAQRSRRDISFSLEKKLLQFGGFQIDRIPSRRVGTDDAVLNR